MKITFRESGGFAPIFRGCELDTASLSPQESAQVQELVDASGILTMRDRRVQGARDVRLYTFILETDRGPHCVTFDQLSIPDSVRPLLDLLRAKSRVLLPDDC